MDGRTHVQTVDDVMAIKPKFLASMGYHIFLAMVLRMTENIPLNDRYKIFIFGRSFTRKISQKPLPREIH